MHKKGHCGCNDKSGKIKIDIPIESSKVTNKKLKPKTAFEGDFY